MLGEYAAWQLSPAAGDAVRSHLDGCGFCRAQAASLTPRTAVMPPPPTKPAPAARAMGPVSPPPVRAPVPARRWFPLVAGGVVCSGLAAGILWAATGSASHTLRSPASPSVSPAPSGAPLSGAASALGTLNADGGGARRGPAMDIQEVVRQAQDTMTVRRVTGEPYEKNGITLISVVAIRGGWGAGAGTGAEGAGEGGGGGFGMVATPVGAYV